LDTLVVVAKRADDLPDGPRVVLLNPDEDCSPAAFRVLVDELLAGPAPALESLGAAAVLDQLPAAPTRIHARDGRGMEAP
jgi:hypothetical protein